MASTPARTKNHRTRADVRKDFGHPWPWMSRDLYREYVIESDRTQGEVAELWATTDSTISEWGRKHGFTGADA